MPNYGYAAEELRNDPQFQRLRAELNDAQELMCSYQCALHYVGSKLDILNEYFSLYGEQNPINDIQTRLKTPESIYEKLLRRGVPLSVESVEKNLYDVAGVRVICSFVDDVYKVAEGLTSQNDIIVDEKKDYIMFPKDNGYRSLHLLLRVPIVLPWGSRNVKVEVQFRTIAMEFWADLEHKMRYKKDVDVKLQNETCRELKRCAMMSAELDRRMQDLRYQIEGKGKTAGLQDLSDFTGSLTLPPMDE